jgi:broad specificity phosphatase PhoE
MLNSTSIYTIRHGETDFNRQKRYAGTLDVPLNQSGIENVHEARRKIELLGLKFDLVISSALRRSIDSALILSGDIPLVRTALCNERDYGKMQGLTSEEVKALNPEILYMWVGGDKHSLNPPGGESFEILRSRAEQFFEYLMGHYANRSLLVVSHGVFLQQFHGFLLGKNWTDSLAIAVPNLEMASFQLAGRSLTYSETFKLTQREQNSW